MSKIEVALLVGAESKEWLASLDAVVTRLEKVAKNGLVAKPAAEESEDQPTPRKSATNGNGKKAKKVVEDEGFELDGDSEGAGDDDLGLEEEQAITIKDVISACKANRETAMKVLKKMGVKNVTELKAAQYPKVLAALGA